MYSPYLSHSSVGRWGSEGEGDGGGEGGSGEGGGDDGGGRGDGDGGGEGEAEGVNGGVGDGGGGAGGGGDGDGGDGCGGNGDGGGGGDGSGGVGEAEGGGVDGGKACTPVSTTPEVVKVMRYRVPPARPGFSSCTVPNVVPWTPRFMRTWFWLRTSPGIGTKLGGTSVHVSRKSAVMGVCSMRTYFVPPAVSIS